MASIRLSDDVYEIAHQISTEKGLGSVRTTIEAVFRTCYPHWLNGACVGQPLPPGQTIGPASPATPAIPETLDVAAELDSVL